MMLSAGTLIVVLCFWSADDVRWDAGEVIFYFVFALAWVVLAQFGFALLGISLRDDVAERANSAAGFALNGYTLGVTFCIAGANVGNGPGFEIVLFCTGLATAALLLLWVLFHIATGAADMITIERDLGMGIRTGGWLAGTGLVLGASVAGDWTSTLSTLHDFVRYTWPVFLLSALLAILERAINLRVPSTRPSGGVSAVLAAAVFAACAAYAKWVSLR